MNTQKGDLSPFEKNLKLFSLLQPEAAEIVKGINRELISEQYPQENTDEWLKNLHPGNEKVIYILGVGEGEYYLAAKEWLQRDKSRCLVFLEPDPSVIYALLRLDVGGELLFDRQVALYLFDEGIKSLPSSRTIIQKYAQKGFVFSTIKRYLPLEPYVKPKLESLSASIQMAQREMLTPLSYVLTNFVTNYLKLAEAYLAKELFNKFKGIPAIICGAGPSLDKNIKLLSTLGNRALIFGGGTTLNALNGQGVMPHFGAGVDPNPAEYTRLVMNEAYETPFFFDVRLNAASLERVHGDKLYVSGSAPYGFSDLIEEACGIKGDGKQIDAGYNVLNFCASLAHAMGCNPIICVGIDLAYSNGMPYASGIASHPVHDRFYDFATKQPKENLVRALDIYGNPIYTLSKWVLESQWYTNFAKEHPRITLINATEGGIGFPGVMHLDLASVKEQYLEKEYDLLSLIHGAIHGAPDANGVDKERIKDCISGLIENLFHLATMYDQLIALLNSRSIHCDQKEEELNAAIAKESGYKAFLGVYSDTMLKIEQLKLYQLKIDQANGMSEIEHKIQKDQIVIFRYESLKRAALCHAKAFEEILKKSALQKERVILPDEEKDLEPSFEIDLKSLPRDIQREVIYDDEGIIRAEYYRQGNLFHGPFLYYHKNGFILAKSLFVNGKREGEMRCYYGNQALHSVKHYHEDKPHGVQKYYYSNGVLKSQIPFLHGLLHGEVLLYYENGQLERRLHFAHGKREGQEEIWEKSGLLILSACYKENHPIGVARAWHANGKISREITYEENGNKIATTHFDERGDPLLQRQEQRKDYLDSVIEKACAFSKEIDHVAQEMGKALPIINQSLVESNQEDLLESQLSSLEREVARLKDLTKQMGEIGMENIDDYLHFSEEKRQEPLWKGSEVERKVQRDLTAMKKAFDEDFLKAMEAIEVLVKKVKKK